MLIDWGLFVWTDCELSVAAFVIDEVETKSRKAIAVFRGLLNVIIIISIIWWVAKFVYSDFI